MLSLFPNKTKPIVLDLFCGLWGWAEGFISQGWNAIGIDLKHPMTIPEHALFGKYDVLNLDRAWLHKLLKRYNIRAIVASPPCQEFSYMSMPWSRAKQIEKAILGKADFPRNYNGGSRNVEQLTKLFRECFRIQRDLCELSSRHIPLVIENVKGAQKWVGKASSHFGSYYLWGDVPALMPIGSSIKCKGSMDKGKQWLRGGAIGEGIKVGMASERRWEDRPVARLQDVNRFGWEGPEMRHGTSHGSRRAAASAVIAKIPLSLSSYLASTLHPH